MHNEMIFFLICWFLMCTGWIYNDSLIHILSYREQASLKDHAQVVGRQEQKMLWIREILVIFNRPLIIDTMLP